MQDNKCLILLSHSERKTKSVPNLLQLIALRVKSVCLLVKFDQMIDQGGDLNGVPKHHL